MYRIKFSNKIITDRVSNKGEHRWRYEIVQWKKRGEFDIFNDISDHVTLVQMIYTYGHVNHAVSITRYWIYDYNYKLALTLIKESLDIICSSSKDEKGMYAKFEDVYYAIRYVNPKAKRANTE